MSGYKKFDETMDSILLKKGFTYYDDWEYGPESGWSEPFDYITLKLMRTDHGYWIIFSRHASGEHPSFNIGISNNAYDIIALRDMLKRMSHAEPSNKTCSGRFAAWWSAKLSSLGLRRW